MSRFYRASEDDLDQFLELGYVLVPACFLGQKSKGSVGLREPINN